MATLVAARSSNDDEYADDDNIVEESKADGTVNQRFGTLFLRFPRFSSFERHNGDASETDIMTDIGTTPSLEPVTDDNFMDLISSTSALRQQPQQEVMEGTQTEEGGDLDNSYPSPSAITPTKEPKCGFCGLVFASYPELVEHRATHGGSRPFECHVCGKKFTQKAHLVIHRRTHTGEKPYACHICHKRFSQTSHLNSHKRVHSGDKPYLCSLCNMGFCRRQRLEAHLQQQHADQLQQQANGMSGMSDMSASGEGYGQSGNTASLFSQMMGSADAKDLLLTMGLSSMMSSAMAKAALAGAQDSNQDSEDDSRDGDGDEDGEGDEESDSSRQVTVFPGFSLGSDEDGEKGGEGDSAKVKHEKGNEEETNADGDDTRDSRSPTPNASSSATATTSSKSRRKPSFVRKLGSTSSQAHVKQEPADEMEENSTAEFQGDENSNGSSTLSNDQAAQQQAAMKAIMGMAGGSGRGTDVTGNDDTNDVINEGNNMDAASISNLLLKQSFLAAAAMAAAARGGGGGGGGGGQLSPGGFSTPASYNNKLKGSGSSAKLSPDSVTAAAAYHASMASLGRSSSTSSLPSPGGSNTPLGGLIRHNSRVSLLNFSAADLMSHMLSRDDAYRCDYCGVAFQDSAMYHLHRSLHDKMDIRKCNLCGFLSVDKYDFTAHFMSSHK